MSLCFEHRPPRNDDVTAAFFILNNLEFEALPHQGRKVCIGGVQIHTGCRSKSSQPEYVHLNAAFDSSGDEALDRCPLLGGFLDFGFHVFFPRPPSLCTSATKLSATCSTKSSGAISARSKIPRALPARSIMIASSSTAVTLP